MASSSFLPVWLHHTEVHLGPFNLDFPSTDGCSWLPSSMNDSFPITSHLPDTCSLHSSGLSADEMQIDSMSNEPPDPAIAIPGQGVSAQSPPRYAPAFRKFHKHTISDSTNTTDSSNSSPTTTISTVDDSSATEPSPDSSPESPPPTSFTVGMLRPRTADGGTERFFELQKEPPPRKERNMKKLALNLSRQPGTATTTTSTTTTTTMLLPPQAQADGLSTTLSPFVKPPTPRRRKPNNLGLSIMTPGNIQNGPHEIKLTIPPTPAFSRPGLLRHFQSSPSLPVVSGLTLRDDSYDSQNQPTTLATILSPVERKESPTIVEADEEQNFEVPLSREQKPEAYPDGPICVYEPCIDLYLEPTVEQARTYDVILNVANEVRNPFLSPRDSITTAEPDLRLDGGGGIQYAPKRDRSMVQSSGTLHHNGSPTTPKATPSPASFATDSQKGPESQEPEYIHVPWDHNSDIVPDLLRLVKLIDDRIDERKKVLIHCQCGVSRSASLVVAYGLYKNPSLSVQEAYDAVKKRSKWIGPNMNLIMQLQEFRSSLARGGMLAGHRAFSPLTPSSALSEWNGPFSQGETSHQAALSAALTLPQSATKSTTTDGLPAVSPGPSSAPSGSSWPNASNTAAQRPRAISAVKAPTAYVDPSGHFLPVLNVVDADGATARPRGTKIDLLSPLRPVLELAAPLASPRSLEFAMTPLQPTAGVSADDSFGIMSPTATGFPSSPFNRTALLASLGMGSIRSDEESPRRSLSLKSRTRPPAQAQNALGVDVQSLRRLRSKISSPTLREQQQLQSLQAKIEATLPNRSNSSVILEAGDEVLMSPRATEFTNNPFAFAAPLPLPPHAANAAPTMAPSTAPQGSGVDPRSPAQKGASPIIRNIWDVL